MNKKKSDGQFDLDRLHEWMAAVGGNIALGASRLLSLDISKKGNKTTIVLKRNRPEKETDKSAGSDES